MKQSAGGRFSGTMIVRPNSWHGRVYRFWQQHAEFKNGSDYRENLCHYSRVVLIWAPLTVVRLVFSIIYEFIEPIIDFFWDVGHGARGFISRHGGSWIGERIDAFTNWFMRVFLRDKKAVGKKFKWGERLGNLFVMAIMTIGPVVGIIYFILHPMQMLMTLGVCAVGAAVLIGLFWCAITFIENLEFGKKKTKAPSTPVRDTIQLAGHMIVATKRGICPFIVFESEEPPKAMQPEPIDEEVEVLEAEHELVPV